MLTMTFPLLHLQLPSSLLKGEHLKNTCEIWKTQSFSKARETVSHSLDCYCHGWEMNHNSSNPW